MSAETRRADQLHKLAVSDNKRLTELTQKVDDIGQSLQRVATAFETLNEHMADIVRVMNESYYGPQD